MSKALETLIISEVERETSLNEIGNQHGFVTGRSTITAMKSLYSWAKDFQNTLVEFMKNPPLKPPEEFDADKAFLRVLSFLPDLKKMNDTQKLDLKLEFMNAVKRIITAPPPNNIIYPSYTDYSNQQNLTYHLIHHPSNAFLPHFQTSFSPYSYPAALNNPVTSNNEEDHIKFNLIITIFYFNIFKGFV
ncbi:unnamed protein product [Macrosiphum euphorbiae]|uniref:BESS domain-containing protein n=1 Tax=Macrosiphum euphorbiae TaxID=13131 RepID=A0AAV0W9J6_9HEMI|nr:unnamed protein product [Macrosiphum euphorbiae]